MGGKERTAVHSRIRARIMVWLVLAVMGICSIVIIRGVLLRNAQRMGNEIAHSYALENEQNLNQYAAAIDLSSAYIDSQLEESQDPRRWISSFLESVANTLGADVVDAYAVIDGEIVAANPWDGDSAYDIAGTDWYQQATEADGRVIFTDSYPDAITGESIITIAKEGKNPGNVVAFDVFPGNFQTGEGFGDLPEGSRYFLCDSGGTLLYSETDQQISGEESQKYVDTIISKIRDGSLEHSEGYMHNWGKQKLAFYYDIDENGWISIVAIPLDSLLLGVRTVSLWYIGILILFLLVFTIMSVREHKRDKDYQRVNETVRALGNSYYAIYRIDFAKGTYEMIKGSDYVRGKIPKEGDYELLLQTIREVMAPDTFEDMRTSFSLENIRRLVKQRVRDYGGDFLRRFDESYRWVNVRLLFDESLDQKEAVMCFREVDVEKHEQLRQIELLRESLTTARESVEAKNAFFSNMSHDMRTPLNAVIGFAELAGEHVEEPDKLRDYLEKIQYSGRQLLALIDDILEISRMEGGELSLDNRHFQIEACLEDCAEVFRSQAEQEGKKFDTSFRIRTKEVYGDAFRLTQILNNLLSNAVKFSAAGDEISLDVTEIETKEYAKYRIIVKDTGAGMSEEFLEKIFVPYERETRFGARNIFGTGLGMSIVKNIVSQMNGEISVKSRLGEGTVFTVILPFKGVSGKNGSLLEQTWSQQEEETGESLEGKVILLAEDNDINMEITCELLNMYGAQVEKAWDGKEAVEAFASSEEGRYDAVLMDMQMPVMDGCEAAASIRKLDREDAKTVPIIAVTANAFAEDLAATAEAGMNAHIPKPIDFQLLCRTLEELL